MKKLITLISCTILLSSCNNTVQNEKTDENDRTVRITNYKNRIDSINHSLDWKETTFGLWKSKNGDLALKTTEATDIDTDNAPVIDKYIKHLADGRPLVEVIDTITFKYLGNTFYKDKNHIYTHNAMADGGNFWIVKDADVKTFKIIGNCYAKDKSHIFRERAIKLDSVDYKTFRTCDDCACYAKDKNGYYYWGDRMDIDNIDIEDEETLAIIEKLKKLK